MSPQNQTSETSPSQNQNQTQVQTQTLLPVPQSLPLATLPAASLPVPRDQAVATVEAYPAAPPEPRSRRNGRIACLPKIDRDFVNRLLAKGCTYGQVVGALDEIGYTVTERNVSSWATGGYLDWLQEQELIRYNRLSQDHIVNHLRRDEATDLSEVGLQAAATRLSEALLQQAARGGSVEASLQNLTPMINLLCRINREIFSLQRYRDQSQVKGLGYRHHPVALKEQDRKDLESIEKVYSGPPDPQLSTPLLPPAAKPATAALLGNAVVPAVVPLSALPSKT